MTTTINADNGVVSGSAGLKETSDSSGVLALQTNGTTAVTVDASQNVNFSGTAQRITGDFSNATIANRMMFQTSTVNGNTIIGAMPNGTATASAFTAFNAADPGNASRLSIQAVTTETQLVSTFSGTGTYLPMMFYTSGSERMRVDTSGNVLVTSPAGLGYGTGSGGTVTQATNKSTTVTLNKPTGQITMNGAALAAGASVQFAVVNSLVGAEDAVVVNTSSNSFTSTSYNIWAGQAASGQFVINVKNVSAGSLSQALILNFAIIKGATS